MTSLRRMARRLATGVMTTLLALVLVEIAGRAAFATLGMDVAALKPAADSAGEKGNFAPHPFLPYSGRPHARSGETTNNSLGFRGPDFTRYKAPNAYRILIFGGSNTYGTATGDLPPWPELLERELNGADSGTRWEVYNFGVIGANSAFSLVNLALTGVHFDPDMVIDYDGGNDMWTFGLSSFKTDYSHCLRDFEPSADQLGFRYFAPEWVFNSQLLTFALYRLDYRLGFTDRGTIWHQVFKDCDLPQDREPFHGVEALLANVKTMKAIAHAYGSDFLGSTYLFRDFDHAELNTHLRGFFAKEGIDFVDVERSAPASRDELLVDDVHFSLEGAKTMARLFAERIRGMRAAGRP